MNTRLIILLITCVINAINGQDRTYYIGAVVDFASKFNKALTPFSQIKENLNEYENYIIQAALNKADIIVFPECGLTSIHLPSDKTELLAYSNVIPDPTKKTLNPCNEGSSSQNTEWTHTLKNLSCAAKTNKIYVVVNLPERFVNDSSREDDQDVIYNTNVVFDRNGNIIARYRKYNLFVEPGFSSTRVPELIKFTTDFNVTFGTFICFDIMFTSPPLDLLEKYQDVTDIVYPTAWFSELPFLTAVQTQAGFARANNVNLLSAGYNNPEGRSGGSGIFTPKGIIKQIMPSLHESTLIFAEIPIIKKRQPSLFNTANAVDKKYTTNLTLIQMATQEENLKNYTTKLINGSVEDLRLCHGEFCCVFDVSFSQVANPDYYYRMIVYEGPRKFGVIKHDVQVCGIAACQTQNVDSCGIRIANPTNPIIFDLMSVRGDMFLPNSTFIPSYADYYLLSSSDYNYNVKKLEKFKQIEMRSVKPESQILAFGIYGTTQNSGNFMGVSMMMVVIVAGFIVKIN